MRFATPARILLRTLGAPLGMLALAGMAPACGSDNQDQSTRFTGIDVCFDGDSIERSDCFEEFLTAYTAETGKETKALLAELEAARLEDDRFSTYCHPLAHAIGRWTYLDLGNIPDSFEVCDQTCAAGCFHGVMERLFFKEEAGDLGDVHVTYEEIRYLLPELCSPESLRDMDASHVFQCLHGLGHALMYSFGYDLDQALLSCDVLAEDWDRQKCYGGVFMENAGAFDISLGNIDPEDPLYPCNAVNLPYQEACYLAQADVMSAMRFTSRQMMDACRQAGVFTEFCIQSVGRVHSVWVPVQEWERVLPLCEEYASGYEDACLYGVVGALINGTGDMREAYLYCNAVKPALQDRCYYESNWFALVVFRMTREEILAQCQEHAWINRELCADMVPTR